MNVPLDVAAFATALKPATIRQLVHRGRISPPDHGLYDLLELVDWVDNRRDQHHAKIAEARYNVDVSRRHSA